MFTQTSELLHETYADWPWPARALKREGKFWSWVRSHLDAHIWALQINFLCPLLHGPQLPFTQ